MTKTLTALAAAATIAAAATVAPTDAHAGRGAAIAAGIFGGLAVGALIGSAVAAPYGYYGGHYYVGPVYPPACFWQSRRVWDGYGWRRARVRVCR
jgi:hypothetical protein